MNQTIQQQRAAYAMKRVLAAAEDKEIHSEYKSYASSLPAMIHTNGLGQAVAFFRSKSAFDKAEDKRNKKEKAYWLLYLTLSDWLCTQETNTKKTINSQKSKPFKNEEMPRQPYSDCDDLLEGITTKNMHHYRLAQAEAQMLMDWVKKFAKAYMTDETSAQKSEGQTT
ncbi:MAG: hypothetical protein RLZZ422_1403 [Pseudomonadota bacterium]|jgi:CRISPR-associated protein Cmr5